MRRRAFLAGGAGTLTVLLPGCSWVPVIPRRPTPTLADAAGWVRHEAGRYTVHLPRAEMGQNVATAFQQIACDELDVPWDAVQVRLQATGDIARVKATVGSESMRDYAVLLAQACAGLRDALRGGATSGVLQAQPVPLAQLRAFSGQARWVGHAAPLVQGREIVTGQPLYAGDVRLAGMLYGRVLRAPCSPDIASRPVAWNEAAARQVPGFVALHPDARLLLGRSQGLAIAAQTPGALDRIEAALAVRWAQDAPADTRPLPAQLDVQPRLARGALAHQAQQAQQGDLAPDDAFTVDLRLEVAPAAHNAIEPRAAVARWQDGVLTLWAGTQDLFYQRDVIARALGLDTEQVRIQGMRIGGAFGGRTLCTVELEAAVLARALGRPVKVQWTRAQELAQGFHRPPSSHRVRARLRGGRLQAWWHAFSSSHILLTNAGMPPWMQGVAGLLGDAGVARGSTPPYRCPAVRVEYDLTRLDLLTGPWRGLGAAPNLLAMESAIDECARAAGADPLAFRLAHLDEPRLAAVLRRAAADARWPAAPPADGARLLHGRGLAGGIYKGTSYAAAVADVEVDTHTGAVRVRALWCAHDCGRVINPDQVRAQTEGNLVWCIGMVLVESLPFADGQVQARTFAESPLPRIGDIGRLHVSLVDSTAAPGGAGETAMVAGAAAIANALRAATGHRFSSVPVRPEDVLRALAGG